ncbi:MAG: glycosyltransferase family 2 protein [Bacteroidetes bacterium]|nr:glycosyltransferase family 2 protein [Bacteroidota bacterium]
MTDIPKVAVVILNWNGKKHLGEFLPSVLASTWPNLDIVVGDNGSTDGSVEFLRQNFPSVKIIQNDQNYGFTGGYNRVLEKVDADYFVLLNSDVEVPQSWIEPVITLMESDALIAVAAPKIKSFLQKDYLEHAGAAGGFIDVFGYPFCRGRMFYKIEDDKGQYNRSDEVFWATGAAMFIKKELWVMSGGFDERFFAHMEEIDLCWRLKNLGYKVMYCAASEVYHLGGGTLNVENPFKTFLNFRNNLLLLQNNLSFWRGLFIIFIRFWMDLLAIARFLNEGKRKDAWAVSRAHQNFVRHIFSRGPRPRNKRSNLPDLKGMYRRSIVWDFFMKKKRVFSALDPKDFY